MGLTALLVLRDADSVEIVALLEAQAGAVKRHPTKSPKEGPWAAVEQQHETPNSCWPYRRCQTKAAAQTPTKNTCSRKRQWDHIKKRSEGNQRAGFTGF